MHDRTDLTVTVNAVAVSLTGRCSPLVSHRGVELAEYALLRDQRELILLGAVEPTHGPTSCGDPIRAEVVLCPRGREVDEVRTAPATDGHVRQGDWHVEPDAWEEVTTSVTSKVIREVFSDDEFDLLQSMTRLAEMLEQVGIWEAHFTLPVVQGWDEERKPIFSLADHRQQHPPSEEMQKILHGLVIEATRITGDQDMIYQLIAACDGGGCPFDGSRLAPIRELAGYSAAERHWSRKEELAQELRRLADMVHGDEGTVIPVIISGQDTLIYSDGDKEVARSTPDGKVAMLSHLGWIAEARG